MSDEENPRAVIGGNNPPDDRPQTTEQKLAAKYAARGAEIERIAKAANEAPKKVRSEDDLIAVGTVVTDAKKIAKRLKTDKAEEKEPHIDANKQIEAFFGAWDLRLDRIAKSLTDRASAYQEEVEAAARLKAEEAAQKAREAAEAERKKADELAAQGARGAARALDKAERLESKAERSERAADAKAADLTRVRSASGVTASSRTSWAGSIVSMDEIDLEKLRPYLRREDVQKALNAFVRIGGRELKGARIAEETKANFRT
ncbi:MAG: hypothetical protein DI527_00350 [Chelatococcus sp.]|nr:MAG: hypothetical protein DI527_00350 [Chelatococcus sp.]